MVICSTFYTHKWLRQPLIQGCLSHDLMWVNLSDWASSNTWPTCTSACLSQHVLRAVVSLMLTTMAYSPTLQYFCPNNFFLVLSKSKILWFYISMIFPLCRTHFYSRFPNKILSALPFLLCTPHHKHTDLITLIILGEVNKLWSSPSCTDPFLLRFRSVWEWFGWNFVRD